MQYGLVKIANNILKNLSISKSSHFRNPTFNDLYWIPGGNSNLMPEFGNNINSNLKILLPYIGSFNFYLFNSKTENMIQWLPIQTYWKASNINKVKPQDIAIFLIKGKNDLRAWHWISYPSSSRREILDYFGEDTKVKTIYILTKK